MSNKAPTNRCRWEALSLLTILLTASCGGTVDTTPKPKPSADCSAFCNKVVSNNCGGDTLEDCTASCEPLRGQLCATQFQQILDCSVYEASYQCSGDRAKTKDCDPEWLLYFNCTNPPADASAGG